jgi:type II secretory pathway pseudopilin PulG
MKKGFLLIEFILVIGIISIILSIGMVSFKFLNKYENQISVEHYSNEIVNFINYNKSYSRKNYHDVIIYVDRIRNEMSSFHNTKLVSKLKLPENIRISYFNRDSIKINKFGYSGSSFTLKLIDNSGDISEITMVVGTNYVSIKE